MSRAVIHPYQLDDTIPPGGMPRMDYMTRKFGSADRIREIHARITQAGTGAGIAFAFDKIAISPNTLMPIASFAGRRRPLCRRRERAADGRIFHARRQSGRPCNARALAGEAGMVEAQVADWLATPEDVESVQADVNHARMMGVQVRAVFYS